MSTLLTNSITTLVGPATGTLFTWPIADNSVVDLTAKAVVRKAATGESADYETKFSVKRFSAGVATLVGAPVPIIANSDVGGWVFAVSVAGNDALVQFTPLAGESVTVRGELEVLRQPL